MLRECRASLADEKRKKERKKKTQFLTPVVKDVDNRFLKIFTCILV